MDPDSSTGLIRTIVLPRLQSIDMPLVDYSSDSSSHDEVKGPIVKRRKVDEKLPPLPSSFRDLYATPIRTSKVDDPDLHSGRQRVNPHVQGNWPTHVYTECKSEHTYLSTCS